MGGHHFFTRTARRAMAASAVALSLAAIPAGQAHADNEYTLSATYLDFGNVDVGSTAQIIVTVTRIAPGSGELNIYGGGPNDGTNFSGAQNCQGNTYSQGESCQFFYTFQPQVGGFLQASTTISFEALDTGGVSDFSLTFEGNGIGEGTTTSTTAGETGPGDTGPQDTRGGSSDTKAEQECRDPSQPVSTDEKGNPRDNRPPCPENGPLPCTTNPAPPATDEKGNPVDTRLPPCPEDLDSGTGTAGGSLPRTGAGNGELFVIAALLTLLGGSVVAATRRAATR